MFDFFKRKKQVIKEEVNESDIARILKVLYYDFKIEQLPEGSVGVIFLDPVKTLGMNIQKDLFQIPLAVYNSCNTFRLYNSELILVGGIRFVGEADGYNIDVWGKMFHESQTGFKSSTILKTAGMNKSEFKSLVEKKFYNQEILYSA